MRKARSAFRVGLGISGGIAAYKAIEVLRLLQKEGCDVRVAMTRNATEFIAPLTLRALSGHYVVVDDYSPENPDPIAHINFSQEIDLLLVVPATANILGKFANGIADDFLSSTYLASNAPVLVAPAMNTSMWDHQATKRNVLHLRDDGVMFVEPVSGELACRTVGTGKLEDVENIVAQAMAVLGAPEADPAGSGIGCLSGIEAFSGDETEPVKDLREETFLITVGGTREEIDPVRYISNRSSGKMGFALAERAAARGACVTAVIGSVSIDPPSGLRIVRAMSAREMFEAVKAELDKASVFIGAAAVSDYRPRKQAEMKIKKKDSDTLDLRLEKTKDILQHVSTTRHDGLLVVGFAAETENVREYARSKLEDKGLDIVVANDITKKGAGFNTDTNIASIFLKGRRDGWDLPLMPKKELADKILDEIVAYRAALQTPMTAETNG